MTTTVPTKLPATLIDSVSNAAGATKRGAIDLRSKVGAFITFKMTNGATGPTAQCVCNVLVSHAAGATPAPASAGPDWKTHWSFGGGTVNSDVTERTLWVEGPQHVAVEFAGNTGQAVTVEAFATVTTAYEST